MTRENREINPYQTLAEMLRDRTETTNQIICAYLNDTSILVTEDRPFTSVELENEDVQMYCEGVRERVQAVNGKIPSILKSSLDFLEAPIITDTFECHIKQRRKWRNEMEQMIQAIGRDSNQGKELQSTADFVQKNALRINNMQFLAFMNVNDEDAQLRAQFLNELKYGGEYRNFELPQKVAFVKALKKFIRSVLEKQFQD